MLPEQLGLTDKEGHGIVAQRCFAAAAPLRRRTHIARHQTVRIADFAGSATSCQVSRNRIRSGVVRQTAQTAVRIWILLLKLLLSTPDELKGVTAYFCIVSRPSRTKTQGGRLVTAARQAFPGAKLSAETLPEAR